MPTDSLKIFHDPRTLNVVWNNGLQKPQNSIPKFQWTQTFSLTVESFMNETNVSITLFGVENSSPSIKTPEWNTSTLSLVNEVAAVVYYESLVIEKETKVILIKWNSTAKKEECELILRHKRHYLPGLKELVPTVSSILTWISCSKFFFVCSCNRTRPSCFCVAPAALSKFCIKNKQAKISWYFWARNDHTDPE